MVASRLTAYLRKKCLIVTDRRVRLMNEILGSIKAIKMYCWESAFAQNIHSESLERFLLVPWIPAGAAHMKPVNGS